MMLEAAVALATFVIVLVVLNRWTRAMPEVAFEDEDTALARKFIRAQIDEHLETLAQSYLEAGGSETGGEDVPGRFAQDIEGFIATALTRENADLEGLGAAVRRVVTLEREQIYAQIVARIQDHLIGHRAA